MATLTTISRRINHRIMAALLSSLRSYRVTAAAAQAQFDYDRYYSYNRNDAEEARIPLQAVNSDDINHRNKAALLTSLRSYRIAAAAAQQQFDYDRYYSYNHNDAGETQIPVPEVNSDESTPVRGVQWVFIGKPNSERQFYANSLAKLLEVPRISITGLVRQDLNPRSFIYKQIAEAVNSGKLVPESIIFGLLSKRLEDGHDRGETGFILDGIPRTRLQAEILDQMVDIDLVVNFKGSEDCFHSGKSRLNSSMSSGKVTDEANVTSSPNNSSADAAPKASTFYKEQMKLLAYYYQDQKKLIDFNAGNAPEETWKALIDALHLQHLNTVSSSRALPLDFRVS